MKKSGAAAKAYLPDEIIADILSFLPVRSLFQFKCVSKSFLSLISNPKFIKQHFDRNNKNKQQIKNFFLDPETSDCFTLDIESRNLTFSPVLFGSDQNYPQFRIIWGSCNGLLILADEDSSLFVVNPSTREFRELPRSPFSGAPIDKYGFGYDSSCDDYKVVRISLVMYRRTVKSVSVYNLRADSWRQIDKGPYEFNRTENPEGVLLNGSLHWLCQTGIISFNLVNETFSHLFFPREISDLALLGVIQGCLSGVVYFISNRATVDVWMMEDYGVRDSWKRFTIDCFPSGIDRALPLSTGKVLLNVGTCTIIYDLKEKTYVKFMELQDFPTSGLSIGYEESFFQLRQHD